MGRRRGLIPIIALAVAAALFLPPAAAQVDPEPIDDPLPEEVLSNRGLVIEEFAQFPETESTPLPVDRRLMRHNRINYLGEVPDGSGRLYVPDLNGPLYLVEDGEPQVYLNVAEQFAPDFFSGRGLGSGFGFVAFHPDFATNGKFYTVHTERPGNVAPPNKPTTYPPETPTFLHSVVTEWTADDPAAHKFSGTHREVMRLGMGSQVHAIQQIDFNVAAEPGDEDYGLLYLAVGDGGQGVGTGIPQDTGRPYGKILRIDPLGSNGPGGAYGIPATNPFVGDDGVLDEIYAIGMRDPHRFSFDTQTGRMYLGHILEHAVEAVYEVQAGDNFGWGVREGAFVFNPADRCHLFPLPENDAEFGFTYPVAAYDHDPPPGWSCTSDSGSAISGGFVYRGDDLDAMRGKYVFAELVQGRAYFAEASEMVHGGEPAEIQELSLYDTTGKRLGVQDLVGDERADLRFGRDAEGELYLLAKANGKVWKVVDAVQKPVPPSVHESIADDVVASYDFEHPFQQDGREERDQAPSDTLLRLINGGEEMRVADSAHPGSNQAIQLQQVNPVGNGNDDWKAGVCFQPTLPGCARTSGEATDVNTLAAFNGAEGITLMGWFKMTGQNPSPNTVTSNPDDFYNAVGLSGILSGDSDGHAVRALLEVISVNGELRLVALGRRIDGGASQTFAANEDWRTLLPQNEWVHLAATFDYLTGEMALYRNGKRLDGFYTVPGNPWQVDGVTGTSPTDPLGIKIGGSFPQDTLERNPCNCRADGLLFLDRAVNDDEVRLQYRLLTR
jgi:glucose/arabinose dehydrogenase